MLILFVILVLHSFHEVVGILLWLLFCSNKQKESNEPPFKNKFSRKKEKIINLNYKCKPSEVKDLTVLSLYEKEFLMMITLLKQKKRKEKISMIIFNRPGVAGAVL